MMEPVARVPFAHDITYLECQKPLAGGMKAPFHV